MRVRGEGTRLGKKAPVSWSRLLSETSAPTTLAPSAEKDLDLGRAPWPPPTCGTKPGRRAGDVVVITCVASFAAVGGVEEAVAERLGSRKGGCSEEPDTSSFVSLGIDTSGMGGRPRTGADGFPPRKALCAGGGKVADLVGGATVVELRLRGGGPLADEVKGGNGSSENTIGTGPMLAPRSGWHCAKMVIGGRCRVVELCASEALRRR